MAADETRIYANQKKHSLIRENGSQSFLVLTADPRLSAQIRG
jgi:hypothetical protein